MHVSVTCRTHGLKVIRNSKGRSVVTTKTYHPGEDVCEYLGHLFTRREGLKMEKKHGDQPNSYLFFFTKFGRNWCIDATEERAEFGFGRLINHSITSTNLDKVVRRGHDGRPHLFFVASKFIPPNAELLYDYGVRDPDVVKANPWLGESQHQQVQDYLNV